MKVVTTREVASTERSLGRSHVAIAFRRNVVPDSHGNHEKWLMISASSCEFKTTFTCCTSTDLLPSLNRPIYTDMDSMSNSLGFGGNASDPKIAVMNQVRQEAAVTNARQLIEVSADCRGLRANHSMICSSWVMLIHPET